MTTATNEPERTLPASVYFVPAVPTAVVLFYVAYKSLGAPLVSMPTSQLVFMWLFLTLSLVPFPFILRRVVRDFAPLGSEDITRLESLLEGMAKMHGTWSQAVKALQEERETLDLSNAMEPTEGASEPPPQQRSQGRTLQFVLLLVAFLVVVAIASLVFVHLADGQADQQIDHSPAGPLETAQADYGVVGNSASTVRTSDSMDATRIALDVTGRQEPIP